jgi:hypothetical protein
MWREGKESEEFMNTNYKMDEKDKAHINDQSEHNKHL